jgi:hypothetical protein
MESRFSRELENYLRQDGPGTLRVIERLVVEGEIGGEELGEACRWLGHDETPIWFPARIRGHYRRIFTDI